MEIRRSLGRSWQDLHQFRGCFVFCVDLVLLAVNPRGSAPRSVTSVSSKLPGTGAAPAIFVTAESNRSPSGNATAPLEQGHPTSSPSSGVKDLDPAYAEPALQARVDLEPPDRINLCPASRFLVSSPQSCWLPWEDEDPRLKHQGGFQKRARCSGLARSACKLQLVPVPCHCWFPPWARGGRGSVPRGIPALSPPCPRAAGAAPLRAVRAEVPLARGFSAVSARAALATFATSGAGSAFPCSPDQDGGCGEGPAGAIGLHPPPSAPHPGLTHCGGAAQGSGLPWGTGNGRCGGRGCPGRTGPSAAGTGLRGGSGLGAPRSSVGPSRVRGGERGALNPLIPLPSGRDPLP